ncbi:DNA-binding TFAR19-related protein [Fomitiporia mediterranea MF3/22]|uniref:DNA-binding TFAR19-related protein n=1 Tax=Fomitiporia mediterranea (strain MF3/22) TaxID=694068 RepID=UPI0004408295|nr:DNA-binding TFAR19-related protein [Fomitiporia mediterranea MF3/22]EJD06085.1 DNA-binding TFAR19-related protein [Fomitiporia mediterranea MF3/22]
MDDQELAAIRAARLQQLRQNASPPGQTSSSSPQGFPSPPGGGNNDPDAEAKRAAEEQMRRDLLATVLDQKARERLARIALVSPTRSSQMETILLRMAQTGQLRGRVGEDQLISLLEQAEDAQSKVGAKKGAIVYQRRKELDDENDDFDFDL